MTPRQSPQAPRSANARARGYRKSNHGSATPVIDPNDRRVVIYVRVSKARDDMTSPAVQVDYCKAHAKRMGWQVVAEPLIDEGESAYAGKAPRPMFQRALDLVRTGAANTLMVYKLDRFMRDASSAVRVKDSLHGWGGALVSASEALDTADPSGTTVVMFSVLSSLAEIESRTKSDRMAHWHAARYVREGGALPPGGPRPYGYTRKRIDDTTTTLEIVESEATKVRDAAARVLNGEGLKSIADEGTFSRTGLKHILTSETTTGLRFDGTTHHEGNWEPILDRDTWERLCATLNDPNRLTAGPRGERRHMLAGLMTCGACGSVMYSRTHPKGPRYGCSARKCYNSISTRAADAAVYEHMLANIDGETWATMRASGRGNQADVVDGFKRKLAVITDTYINGPSSPEAEADYVNAKAMLNDRIRQAQEAEPMALPDVHDWVSAWRTMDVDAKRLIVNAWFDKLTVDSYAQGMSTDDRLGFTYRS